MIRPSQSQLSVGLPWSAVLVVLLVSIQGWAQGNPKPTVQPNVGTISDGRRRDTQKGLAAILAGDYSRAEEVLESAFRTTPSAEILYHLGRVAQARGRSVAAIDLYRRYLDLAGAQADASATTALKQLESTTTNAYSTVTVTAPSGMLLIVDERVAGLLPLPGPLLLPSGPHRFRIERRKERFDSDHLSIPEGRLGELRLTPGAKGTAITVLSLTPIALLILRPQNLADASQKAILKSIRDSTRSDSLAYIPEEKLLASVANKSAECLSKLECQIQVAEQTEARAVLVAEPSNAKVVAPSEAKETGAAPGSGATLPATCSLHFEYVDVSVGQVTAQGTTASTQCGGQALTDAIIVTMRQLLSESRRTPRGTLVVNSDPQGAHVLIDGIRRGVTPLQRPSLSGSHQILIESDHHLPFQTTVDIQPGQISTVEARLEVKPIEQKQVAEPKPVVVPPEPRRPRYVIRESQQPRPRWRLIVGGIGLGGGLLMASFGVSALAVNEQCADVPATTPVCDTLYYTRGVGGGLLGVGIAVAIGGSVLLAIPGQRVKQQVITDVAIIESR